MEKNIWDEGDNIMAKVKALGLSENPDDAIYAKVQAWFKAWENEGIEDVPTEDELREDAWESRHKVNSKGIVDG